MMTNRSTMGLPALRTTLLAAGAALFAATLCTAPMFAQDPGTPPPAQTPGMGGGMRGNPAEMEQRQLDRMTKQLSLTTDQVTQIKAIQADGRTKMTALREDTSTPQADKRGKMMAMRTEQEAKIKAVLTDDQKTKYDAMMAQEAQRRRQGGGPGGPGGPPPPPPSL